MSRRFLREASDPRNKEKGKEKSGNESKKSTVISERDSEQFIKEKTKAKQKEIDECLESIRKFREEEESVQKKRPSDEGTTIGTDTSSGAISKIEEDEDEDEEEEEEEEEKEDKSYSRLISKIEYYEKHLQLLYYQLYILKDITTKSKVLKELQQFEENICQLFTENLTGLFNQENLMCELLKSTKRQLIEKEKIVVEFRERTKEVERLNEKAEKEKNRSDVLRHSEDMKQCMERLKQWIRYVNIHKDQLDSLDDLQIHFTFLRQSRDFQDTLSNIDDEKVVKAEMKLLENRISDLKQAVDRIIDDALKNVDIGRKVILKEVS